MQEERVFGAADEEEYIETVTRAQQEIEESQRLRVVDEDGSKGGGGWRYKTAQKDREERARAREVEQVVRHHDYESQNCNAARRSIPSCGRKPTSAYHRL
jgi:hypothetical protein